MQQAVMIRLKSSLVESHNAHHIGSIFERDERKIQVHGDWIVALQPSSYVSPIQNPEAANARQRQEDQGMTAGSCT